MPTVIFHKAGEVFSGEVKDNTNLVVRAGIKQFPFPHLRYQCGMGKCATCACLVLGGAEHLPPPNWKEKKQLGERLDCPASAITESVIDEHAVLRLAPTPTRAALHELFQHCNQARYAPVRGTGELNFVAVKFEKAVGELLEVKA